MILRSPDKCCSQAGSADAVTFRSPTLVPNALVRCYAPAPNGGVGGVAGPAHHPFGRRPLELCSERLREIKRRRENIQQIALVLLIGAPWVNILEFCPPTSRHPACIDESCVIVKNTIWIVNIRQMMFPDAPFTARLVPQNLGI